MVQEMAIQAQLRYRSTDASQLQAVEVEDLEFPGRTGAGQTPSDLENIRRIVT